MHKKTERELLGSVIGFLLAEKGEIPSPKLASWSMEELWRYWRGLTSQRPAAPIASSYLESEAQLLSAHAARCQQDKRACQPSGIPRLFLYEGDLCQLAVEAIVNPANSQLLGCQIPNHGCLDNQIHFYAGVELRQYCAASMQGKKEAVGQARVTPAFHLPADWIIHTVGPFVSEGRITPIRQYLLQSCYRSCLDLALAKGIETLAFPSISTGEFGYPKEQASQVAVETVLDWQLTHHFPIEVIFSTFLEEDRRYYEKLLAERSLDGRLAGTGGAL